MARHVRPLRRFAATGDDTAARAGLRELVARLRERTDVRHLITLEDLAELPAEAVALLLEELRELDVHVVVTARHWGLTIPSEWQQDVKERGTRPYAAFVAAVRARRPASRTFRARQELPEILRRWSVGLAPDHVHVIAVPPSSRTTGTLLELFCGVIGIEPDTLAMPEPGINASLSLAQAEMLRQVNAELGDRMPKAGGVYKEGVRAWLSRGSLMQHERTPILLPANAVDWCVGETRRQRDEVLALGIDLLGDSDDLLADPGAASGPASPDVADVAAVAISTVADLTDLRWSEREEGRSSATERPEPRPRSRSALRAVAGRVRARLRRT